MFHLIKDTEFEQIMKHLIQVKGIQKKDTKKLRLFIEAVVMRTEWPPMADLCRHIMVIGA